jgi:methionyl-tRNA formyltransferase
MRLIFAGTPGFAARALAALLDAGHEVALVLTQPDRPAGRGMRLVPSAVKSLAVDRHLEVYQPVNLKDAETRSRLHALGADVMVVAAYGLILPGPLLEVARLGAINIHASLLPRWRGAAPIQRAILAGDAYTGISIMQMDRGLDTGPIFASEPVAIAADDDSASLHDKLADTGARLMVTVLGQIEHGGLRAQAQPSGGASYAAKITKAEAEIDWSDAAPAIGCKVRAFNPQPGASAMIRGAALKIWRAGTSAAGGVPGTVLEAGPKGIVVACGAGALVVQELQRAGGRKLAAAQFLAGFAVAAGERLEFSPKTAN